MPSSDENVAIVREIFNAAGRGDIGAVLARLHEDIEWEFGASAHGIPWLAPGKGHAHVRRFFETMGSLLKIEHFELHELVGSGPWVLALITIEFTVRRTGKRVRDACQVQVWKLDDSGKVVASRHAADTYQHHAAFVG